MKLINRTTGKEYKCTPEQLENIMKNPATASKFKVVEDSSKEKESTIPTPPEAIKAMNEAVESTENANVSDDKTASETKPQRRKK